MREPDQDTNGKSGRRTWLPGRRVKGSLAAAAVVGILVLLGVILFWRPLSSVGPRGAETAIRDYLAAMDKGRLDRVLAMLEDGVHGLDPAPPAGSSRYRLGEAEAAGLVAAVSAGTGAAGMAGMSGAAEPVGTEEAARRALAVLSRQRELVRAEFGPDAWRRATWRLEPVPARDDGAETAVIPYLPRPVGSMGSTQTYLAHLSFGAPAGRGGCNSFTLTVSNRSGAWKVCEFCWCEPDTVPPGDI